MAKYFIIGGDGKQYGPVSGEDLRRWIPENRVQAQTQAQQEGTGEWRPLAEFPEFAGAFSGATPPPLPAGAPAGPAKTSAMAITSLVLGILGLFTCGLTALVGLILGIIAMVKVKGSNGALKGNGLALAGTVVSGVSLLLLLLILPAMLLPALAAAKQKAQVINCVSNEKQLALAVMIYSGDHTNRFPPAATWCDAIKTAAGSEQIFKCPAVNTASRCDYAFNAKLDGLEADKVNPQTVMLFESNGGWNASGGSESLPANARHERGKVYVIAFADGHVEAVNQSRLNTLRWDP